MSKILVDGRFVGYGESMARYTLELLSHILEIDHENEYTLLIRRKTDDERLKNLERFSNLKLDILDVPHYSISEQSSLLFYLNEKKYDLVHFTQFNHPIFYGGKYVSTIHDLILLYHSDANFLKKMAFGPVVKSAARDSAAVITASTETRDEIVKKFAVDQAKINLIFHGIDHDQFNIRAKNDKESLKEFCQKNNIENDYLLYVGAWKKHKNVAGMIEAYEKFILSGDRFVNLVLVGKVDQREKRVIEQIAKTNKIIEEKIGKNNAVIASGPVGSDAELAAIYAGAIAYVMPSLAEGFGWPPLEAMACGTPVISSNKSCMPEILGDAALYFDPTGVEEISESIKKIINDHTLREKLIKLGLDQAQKYNWEETAKKTLEVYKGILEK